MIHMKQLELSTWKKVNNSFRKRLIYHAGIDCGFFVELNYMINAMLYCLSLLVLLLLACLLQSNRVHGFVLYYLKAMTS